MKNTPLFFSSALPSRPHAAASYWTAGRLPDLAGSFWRPSQFRIAPAPDLSHDHASGYAYGEGEQSGVIDCASIVAFALTPPIAPRRPADTWSWSVVSLPGRPHINACTTFDGHGCLLLEISRTAWDLSQAEIAAIARAFVAGHVREQARTARRGKGRN